MNSRLGALAFLLAALAAACGSSNPPPQPDAGPLPSKCAEVPDAGPPCVLGSGTPVSGTIAVAGQNDLYTIEQPAGVTARTLLKVQLANLAPVSPVRLVVFVESPDGKTVLGSRGPVAGTGAQSLSFNLLLPGPGLYRVRVRDSLGTHVDANNAYSLTATLLPDPDTGEPDDTPAKARQITPAAGAGATATGYIASSGDRDFLGFTLAGPQLLRVQVTEAAVPAGPLRLRARLLLRSASAPDDLTLATPVIDSQATTAGAALAVDLIRSVTAGSYLVVLEDAAGTGADERAQAAWTVTLGLVTEPDPNEQNGKKNDTPDQATPLLPGQPKDGAIGSQGDVDWYQVDLLATATPQLLQLTLDPQQANTSLQLNWAVGTLLAAPAGPCDFTCTLTAFCAGGLPDGGGAQCAYKAHAFHQFAHGETAPQTIRIRHLGDAETVRVIVDDRSGVGRSTDLYRLTATILPDPDPNEQAVLNDTSSSPTVVQPVTGDGGSFSGTASGMISWWDFLDGKTTAEQAADLDWYELQMPPRLLAPDCPPPPDAGPDAGADAGSATSTDAGTDAGVADAGPPNRLPDGGVCGPDPYDGGPVYLPLPDYGMVMKWKNPTGGNYRIGFQGLSPVDGGTACLFSFDDSQGQGTANAKDAGSGFVQVGDAPYAVGDLCFCLAGAQAEAGRVQVRVEAAHRPTPPGANSYGDQPYQFSLELRPQQLPPACDGGCAAQLKPSVCP